MKYYCSECNLSVIVIGEKFIRACNCNSSIVANISGTVRGEGGFSKS